MLYPPISELLKRIDSRYLLVNVVARRARQLSSEAGQAVADKDKKPVTQAIEEVAENKLRVRIGSNSGEFVHSDSSEDPEHAAPGPEAIE